MIRHTRPAVSVAVATVEIVDIPGLAKGASHGEGIGNKFLVDIQQVDAMIHVLRCFDDENLPHVEGSINPVRDLEIVDLELQIKDLEMDERKIQRTVRHWIVSSKPTTRKSTPSTIMRACCCCCSFCLS